MGTNVLGSADKKQNRMQDREPVLHSRMQNPAVLVPEAMHALQALGKTSRKRGVPARTLGLIELRARHMNDCSLCVDMHSRELKQSGESDERLFVVAAWRDVPYFTNADRAALALAEAVTRISDRPDPVPYEIWDESCKYYDEIGLSSLLISIAAINVWNRFNVNTKQVAGPW